MLADVGQEIGWPDCFQILTRRLAVLTAFRCWPGYGLASLLSDVGQEIGCLNLRVFVVFLSPSRQTL